MQGALYLIDTDINCGKNLDEIVMSNRLYTVSTLGIDLLSILGFITFP